ncbi:hypothetical protein HK101_007952 [Irineochytrium annulatum]|nr:hypothetical protein HK101_007952 [Irineochytrium annulatum]
MQSIDTEAALNAAESRPLLARSSTLPHVPRTVATWTPAGPLTSSPGWVLELKSLIKNEPPTPRGTFINAFFSITLFVSIVLLCLGTVPSFTENKVLAHLFFWLNLLSILIFTVEFVIDCVVYTGSWLSLAMQPIFVIDFLAIFPFYIEIVGSVAWAVATGSTIVAATSSVEGFAALRVLRLLRVFRLFKVFDKSSKLRLLSQALTQSSDGILVLGLVAPLLVCFFGTLLYYAEMTDEYYKDGVWYYTNGDKSPFQSIPRCFWISIVTLTTVGYGDQTPRTAPGRLVSAVASLTALVFLAFPLTVITSQYTSVLAADEERAREEADRVKRAEADRYRREVADLLAACGSEKKDEDEDEEVRPASPASAGGSGKSPVAERAAGGASLLEISKEEGGVVSLKVAISGEDGFRRLLMALSNL